MFDHPAVQSAVLPFLLALVWIYVFRNHRVWLGLAGVLAFLITVFFVNGAQLLPLTSTRKIIVLSGAIAALGFLLDWLQQRTERPLLKTVPRTLLLFVVCVCAVAWVLWPLMQRSLEGIHGVLFVFVAWLVITQDIFREQATKGAVNLVVLGLGVSIACFMGASALYGQLATPFSVVVGVYLLLYLLQKTSGVLPTDLYLPAVLVPAVLAASATVYASLPAVSLVFIAIIPLMLHIPVPQSWSAWTTIIVRAVLAMLPVVGAVLYLLTQAAQEGAYYG